MAVGRARYLQVAGRGVQDVAGAPISREVQDLVDALARACRKEREEDARQTKLVQELRAAGASWRTIGKARGTSGEGAHKRYARLCATAGTATGDVQKLVAALTRARSKEQHERDRQGLLVQKLRAAGVSWTVVGHARGTTREGAHKKYAKDELV